MEKSNNTAGVISEFNNYLTFNKELEIFRELIMRSGIWKRYKFKELVNNLNNSETKPLEKGLERYVGLENICSETFDIQGYGLIKNGTSFTKRFFSGNVLFSKRRSYLKKVAVADFDGICSGDVLVFEVKKEKQNTLLPTYLPYIVRSNDFIHFATFTSAGSLSPRTKWKEIADYEFGLPSITEQEVIVKVLKQFDFVTKQLNTKINNLQEQLEHLRISITNDSIS
jgi:type I restriction enzyme, S subunit